VEIDKILLLDSEVKIMDQEPRRVVKMKPLTGRAQDLSNDMGNFFHERLGTQSSQLDSAAERFVFVLTGRDRPVVGSDPRPQELKEQYERSVHSATTLLREFIKSKDDYNFARRARKSRVRNISEAKGRA